MSAGRVRKACVRRWGGHAAESCTALDGEQARTAARAGTAQQAGRGERDSPTTSLEETSQLTPPLMVIPPPPVAFTVRFLKVTWVQSVQLIGVPRLKPASKFSNTR